MKPKKPKKETSSAPAHPPVTDVLNIAGDLVPELDAITLELLERGKNEKVMILAGTEGGKGRKPYAVTTVQIDFDSERDLRNCVRLLRWSDERLRARPEQMILWDWNVSYRNGMTISFGVSWYDREFYEKRKNAFMENDHVGYYAMFGATPDRFKMKHKVMSKG